MNLFDPSDPRPVHFVGIGGAGMSALGAHRPAEGGRRQRLRPRSRGRRRRGRAWCRCGQPPRSGPRRPAPVRWSTPRRCPPTIPNWSGPGNSACRSSLARRRWRGWCAAGTVVGIAGTHGKTTTTVMATEALAAAGLAPTGLAGGRVGQWGGNARLDGDALFRGRDRRIRPGLPGAHALDCRGQQRRGRSPRVLRFAGRARGGVCHLRRPGAERV